MDVLGIEVDLVDLVRWRDWLMPETQPFLIDKDAARAHALAEQPNRLTMELRDSFEIYGEQPDAICWLERHQAAALPKEVRRHQPTTHHWPSKNVDADIPRLVQYLEQGRRRSRHEEVSEESWQRAAQVLPGARRIGGRFPGRSGPNCFGAVMAAAGVPHADEVWMLRQPFEEWLAAGARRGGRDEDTGTVLVWRSSDDGLVQHAAVTLGGGLALHKPSQGWQSPTKILHTDEVKLSARSRGRRLQRYTIA